METPLLSYFVISQQQGARPHGESSTWTRLSLPSGNLLVLLLSLLLSWYLALRWRCPASPTDSRTPPPRLPHTVYAPRKLDDLACLPLQAHAATGVHPSLLPVSPFPSPLLQLRPWPTRRLYYGPFKARPDEHAGRPEKGGARSLNETRFFHRSFRYRWRRRRWVRGRNLDKGVGTTVSAASIAAAAVPPAAAPAAASGSDASAPPLGRKSLNSGTWLANAIFGDWVKSPSLPYRFFYLYFSLPRRSRPDQDRPSSQRCFTFFTSSGNANSYLCPGACYGMARHLAHQAVLFEILTLLVSPSICLYTLRECGVFAAAVNGLWIFYTSRPQHEHDIQYSVFSGSRFLPC